MNASLDAYRTGRSTAIDDIYSLICVAFTFVFLELPWTIKITEILENVSFDVPIKDLNKLFIEVRHKYHKEF